MAAKFHPGWVWFSRVAKRLWREARAQEQRHQRCWAQGFAIASTPFSPIGIPTPLQTQWRHGKWPQHGCCERLNWQVRSWVTSAAKAIGGRFTYQLAKRTVVALEWLGHSPTTASLLGFGLLWSVRLSAASEGKRGDDRHREVRRSRNVGPSIPDQCRPNPVQSGNDRSLEPLTDTIGSKSATT